VTPALAAAVAALEAERLAPVPRNSHAVAVDAVDLTLVLDHAQATGRVMTGDVASAYQKLACVIRAHAARARREARQELPRGPVATRATANSSPSPESVTEEESSRD
jgi:hypothetical protein